MRRIMFNFLALLMVTQQAIGAEAISKFYLEEGASVRLRLEEAVSTKTSAAGQKLKLTVLEDVVAKDGKTVVVKEGTNAIGYLTNLDEKDGSKGGKLSIEVSSVKAIDGTRISLRGIKTKNGAGGAGVGSYLAGGLLLGVVGLGAVALAGRSHNAKIPAGSLITSFVDRDATIEIASSVETTALSRNDTLTPAAHTKAEIASKNIGDKNEHAKAETKTSD